MITRTLITSRDRHLSPAGGVSPLAAQSSQGRGVLPGAGSSEFGSMLRSAQEKERKGGPDLRSMSEKEKRAGLKRRADQGLRTDMVSPGSRPERRVECDRLDEMHEKRMHDKRLDRDRMDPKKIVNSPEETERSRPDAEELHFLSEETEEAVHGDHAVIYPGMERPESVPVTSLQVGVEGDWAAGPEVLPAGEQSSEGGSAASAPGIDSVLQETASAPHHSGSEAEKSDHAVANGIRFGEVAAGDRAFHTTTAGHVRHSTENEVPFGETVPEQEGAVLRTTDPVGSLPSEPGPEAVGGMDVVGESRFSGGPSSSGDPSGSLDEGVHGETRQEEDRPAGVSRSSGAPVRTESEGNRQTGNGSRLSETLRINPEESETEETSGSGDRQGAGVAEGGEEWNGTDGGNPEAYASTDEPSPRRERGARAGRNGSRSTSPAEGAGSRSAGEQADGASGRLRSGAAVTRPGGGKGFNLSEWQNLIGDSPEANETELYDWEKFDLQVKQGSDGPAEKAGMAAERLAQMPVHHPILRQQVLPMLARQVTAAAAGGKASDGRGWRSQSVLLDDGREIRLSTRRVDGVLQVKIGSLNGDLHRLLVQHEQEIREHLEKTCGVELELQLEEQPGEAFAGLAGGEQPAGGKAASIRAGTEGAVETEPEASPSVRHFGYNRMEWTA